MSLDPLASTFPDWSPYVYVADNPTAFVDNDGRAPEPPSYKYLAISFGNDVAYRANNMSIYNDYVESKVFANKADVTKSLVKTFKAASSDGEIAFAAVFSHGSRGQIFAQGEYDFSSTGSSMQGSELAELGKAIKAGDVKFSDDAVIYMGACNCGTKNGTSASFAQELADVTGAEVIAMVNDQVAPVKESKGKSKNPVMSYGAAVNPKKNRFHIFKKGENPKKVGVKSFDVIKKLKETKKTHDKKIDKHNWIMDNLIFFKIK